MTYRIGLTGGIGCGKSTVSALFEQCGITVVDTDIISHQLTQAGGGAIAAIRSAFGNDYIDTHGALDRPRMRQRIFSDNTAKLHLETILHPLICTEMLAQSSAMQSSPYLILVIPLLFETPTYRERVQRTLVIDCPEEMQLTRAMQRSGLDEVTLRAIISAQITRTERLRLTDDIIQNDGDLDHLQRQVNDLHSRYLALAAGSD